MLIEFNYKISIIQNILSLKVKNMKRLNNMQTKNNNRIIAITTAMAVFFMDSPVYAQNNLYKAKTALKDLQAELVDKIIPVAVAVILLALAIGYAGRYIGKDTFVR